MKKGSNLQDGPEHSRTGRLRLTPPRKSLGQHFLIDQNIARKIIRLAELQPGETVVEIGPGRGILTEALVDAAGCLIAVELDGALCAHLRALLEHRRNFKLIEGDALTFDFGRIPQPFLVVANLPYNVATPILFRLLAQGQGVLRMVLMLQAEVVDRLTAAPGEKDYGVLSVAAQFRSEVRRLFKVAATCFRPVPQVESSVVVVTPLACPRVPVVDEALFFRVVRGGFAHRRKALLNSLRDEGFNGENAAAALREAGIDHRRRAETLSIEEFARLANLLA